MLAERVTTSTADLAELDWAATIPQRFRLFDIVDMLAQPVESKALPEVLGFLIGQPLKGKAAVYREARKLWSFDDIDCDGWRVGQMVMHLREGKSVKAATLASLRDLQDALRHERQHQFGNPLTRTRNGITTQAKRPMTRAYRDDLNPPDARPSSARKGKRLRG